MKFHLKLIIFLTFIFSETRWYNLIPDKESLRGFTNLSVYVEAKFFVSQEDLKKIGSDFPKYIGEIPTKIGVRSLENRNTTYIFKGN